MLAILLSASFVSCKDEEDDISSNKTSNAISFSTYTAGATRAADVTADVLKGKIAGRDGGFNVSAWYDGKLYLSDKALFQNGLAIDNTNKIPDAFDTEKETYYWPSFSAGNVKFYAFNAESGAKWTDANCKWIEFPVQQKASEQKDLVVAYNEAAAVPTDGVQPLNFVHTLSKVNFSFVGADDYTYTVNRVEVIAAGERVDLSGVSHGPQLSFKEKSTSLQNTEAKFSWGSFDAINDANPLVKKNAGAVAAQGVLYTYYSSADSSAKAGTVVNGQTETPLNASLMLLPQTGKIAIRVYYKVEDGAELIGNCGYTKTDASGNHDVTDGVYGCKTIIVNLGAQIANGWEAGKSYRFVVTLPTDNFLGDSSGDGVADGSDDGQSEDYDGDGDKDKSEFGTDKYIEFAVKVTSWGEGENVPATIIIK